MSTSLLVICGRIRRAARIVVAGKMSPALLAGSIGNLDGSSVAAFGRRHIQASARPRFIDRRRTALAAVLLTASIFPFGATCLAAATAAPVFAPSSSTYHTVQTVTISDSIAGAAIYYTTDGTTPTTRSTLYTGPIAVNASTSLAAIAVPPAGAASAVARASYTIQLPAAMPVASPAAGAYGTPQAVTLTDSTPGAVIHYTTNGVYPTSSSPVYSSPFVISSNATLQAWATAPNYEAGPLLSAGYTIAAVPPTISPGPGTYTAAQTVTLTSPTPGAYFHYTIDGSTPTSSSPWYSGPFTVSANTTVQAATWATSYTPSATASSAYTIVLGAATPVISPAAGTYVNPQTVKISSTTPGAVIYYTLDGSAPTTSSAVYSGPLTVSSSQTVSAKALAPAFRGSDISRTVYTITPPAAAPVFAPAAGNYNTVQTVSISDATPGATIYYTTNGSAPTSQSTPYTGPITLQTTTTVEAAALAPGGSLSPVAKGYFGVILPTSVPVISPPSGTYNSIQSVTLSDSTPGATIYYTTDGSYPSQSSAVYSGPISAVNGTQIRAMATAPGFSVAGSASASYTIVAPAPSISPASGTFQNTATVAITDAVPGATIYYTNNGSAPTTASAVYSGPIALSPQQTTTEVYEAIAVAPGYLQSSPAMATFTVNLPAGVLAQATVASAPTIKIPADFLGLSTDFNQPPLMMGQASTGVNQAYRTLLNNLTANATAPLLFRITGDDSQVTGIQAAIEPLLELSQAVNVNYILGVDLWNNNLSTTQAETSAWMSGLPSNIIHAIEIGNEPDNYQYNGARPSTYTFAQYLSQFQQWQQGIDSTTGSSIGLMGSSMGAPNWVPSAQKAIAAGTLTPTIASQHDYLGGLTQPNGQPWPSDYLLQPASATAVPAQFASFAASAHQAGMPFRMSEINSFYAGGVPGISNAFQSALWSIDIMFNYLNNGMDGVNWHSGQGTQYQLFQFHPQTTNGMTTFTVSQVAPLYYGLLVFSQMAGNNAQLLPVSTSTTANVSIWATVDSNSAAHVVVLNKDEQATGDVQITLPGYTTGTVRYLTAANYSATNGVTFAGQTFDGTPDGTIQGQYAPVTINATNGVFTLPDMPITSAALIDFTN
jgi:hypothetical protein